ncbi:MAG TPA: hypothetical protein VFB06_35600 [Streptosporangiaceae bacterium]|nr:hypothetical protein [Streptosporangiaceae bacterium]
MAPNDIAISCPEPCTAPERAVPLRRDLIIWGAHGGAGTSTLATLLRPARDMGALRTEADYRYPAPRTADAPVLVA